MLIRDKQVQARDHVRQRFEAAAAATRSWAIEQLYKGRVIEDWSTSVANPEFQAGHPMLHTQLETLLHKISDKLLFEQATNKDMKKLFFIHPDSTKRHICAYPKGPMPEYSIFRVASEPKIDPTLVGDPSKPTLTDRVGEPVTEKEMEDICNKVNPSNNAPDGGEAEALGEIKKRVRDRIPPESQQPGWIPTEMPYGEWRRGWRTVLARLMLACPLLISPERIERLVGSSERESWAVAMGKPIDAPLPF